MRTRIRQFINSRTKSEWQTLVADRFQTSRTWVQDHGELALLLGLLVGFALVFVYELLFIVSLLVILAAGVIWHFAPVTKPEEPTPPPAE